MQSVAGKTDCSHDRMTGRWPLLAAAGSLISAQAQAVCSDVDAVSTGSTVTDTMAIPHTTAGSDRLMIVAISIDNNQGEIVETVTYNGVPLTEVGVVTNSNDARVQIWQLTQANGLPSGGPFDVFINFDEDLAQAAVAGVITFTGVDQTTPLGSLFGNQATSSTGSVTVNSAVGELVLGVFSGETVTSISTDPPANELWNLSASGPSETEFGAGSTDEGAASVSITWSLGSSDHWAAAGIAIKPAGTCGTTIAGTVFEDINYGGGDGRTLAAADASAQASGWAPGAVGSGPGVRLELYEQTGPNYLKIDDTTTDAAGNYTFAAVLDGNYRVRAVNDTVISNRGSNATGFTPLAVQTFRNDPDSGGPVIDEVGGANPSQQDTGTQADGANLASFISQSVTEIAVAGADVSNVDFGFNIDTVVNTNDQAQGSLRQFLLNSNELDNANLDQQDVPSGVAAVTKAAGDEHSIFMIPATELSGAVDGGGGTAMVIQPATELPQVTDTNTAIDGSTQTAFTGDTNALVAETTRGPEVLLDHQGLLSGPGVDVQADNVIIDGMGVGSVAVGVNNNRGSGILLDGVSGATVSNSTVWNVASYGILVETGSTLLQILDNVSRDNGQSLLSGDGVNLSSSTSVTVSGNELIDNNGFGIDVQDAGSNHILENNLLKGNGGGGTDQVAGIGLRLTPGGSGITIRNNTITGNAGDGIIVDASYTAVSIRQNSIFANGDLGIDLSAVASNNGDGVTPNDGGDGDAGGNDLLNFPVISSASEFAGVVTVNFDLDVPAGDYRIEFFANPSGADPSTNGEGEIFTDPVTISHGGTGVESFVDTFAGAAGDIITATATESGPVFLSTSEYSVAYTVTASTGLLARYWLDEADSGQGPATLIDDSPSPLNMPLTYVGSSPTWEYGSGGNRHLRFFGTDGTDTGGAIVDIGATKVNAIHGSMQGTLEVKYARDSNVCTGNDGRIFGVADGNTSSDGWFAMREHSLRETLLVKWNGFPTLAVYALGNGTPSCPIDSASVVHWVVDTTQAVAANRVRAYIDGVPATVQVIGGALPALNASITLGTGGRRMFLGRPHNGLRTLRGRIWYAAIYDVALDPATIASNVATINACDDLIGCPLIDLVKRAFWPDGTPIPTGATIPPGVQFRFLLYVNNKGGAVSDVSVRDVLDPGFQYQAGSLQVDNSLSGCALATCSAAEELAIFNAADIAAVLTDAQDGDMASYTGAGSIIDAGDSNAANQQLDVPADSVLAILFSVTMP